jgi:D-2-hydroxyacid dehydrogenase (NADP+)
VLTNSAGVLARDLAETLTGAMLMLNSNLHRYRSQQQAGIWRPLPFTPLCEKTLLLVGVGAIGGHVADNAKALGMRVTGVRASGAPHGSVDEMHVPSRLNDLLGTADVVSLHVRADAETHHMIDVQALAAMKPGGILINTSRGSVVDESALCDALASGHLGGAYLDVFETEPLPGESPLWTLPNVLITPHAADNVADWPAHFARAFADKLERWLAGEELVSLAAE